MDAGDLFLPPALRGAGFLPADPAEVERRARVLFAGLSRIGFDAFAPGERDIAAGVPLLRRLAREFHVPVLSANIVDKRGKLLFDADLLVERAGVKVGIFGVTGALPEDKSVWEAAGLTAQDPAQAARAEITALRSRGARIVIGLLHVGSLTESRSLAAAAPGMDFAILGHSGADLQSPEIVGSTRLYEAFSMGKELGRLDIHVVGDAPGFADRGQRAQTATLLDDHRRQLADVRKRAAEDKTGKLADYFTRREKEIEESIDRDARLLAALPRKVAGSWFEDRLIPVQSSIADHPAVALIVRAYNDESQRLAAAGKTVGIVQHVAAEPPPPIHPAAPAKPDEPLRYAGVVSCGTCHAPELKQWQSTKHAHALEALRKDRRAGDPTCVGCHVTGFMHPGGTRDIALATGRLRDVGCEACHGPGGEHIVSNGKKIGVARKVTEQVCLECHTRDQTAGEFDYTAFVKAILGPGHGA